MAKIEANDPVALAVAALLSSRKHNADAARDFGAFAFHAYHVLSDAERMGEGFKVGPEWMEHDKKAGREALVTRLVQVMFPVPDDITATKDKNVKAVHHAAQQRNRKDMSTAVNMLAGMCRMGDMFGDDGAQWDDKARAWKVPASWFIGKDDELDRVFLSGQRGKLVSVTHVPLLDKNAEHTLRVLRPNKAGDTVEAFISCRPNPTSIAALGVPVVPVVEVAPTVPAAAAMPVKQAVDAVASSIAAADFTVAGEASDAFHDMLVAFRDASPDNRAFLLEIAMGGEEQQEERQEVKEG